MSVRVSCNLIRISNSRGSPGLIVSRPQLNADAEAITCIPRWRRRWMPWKAAGVYGQKRGRIPESQIEKGWWTAGGSNSRPPRCERGALPTELAAHF